MADLEFVDPTTGAALGTHAFGEIAAGTASTAYDLRLRYKWGQSGSGLWQNALLLEVSTDGGVTWDNDLAEFTLAVVDTDNVPSDPLFLGALVSARRTSRLELPALRAGCAYDLELKFHPTLRTGTATTDYSWRLSVVYNESVQVISLNPDAPTGVLTGLGDESVSEWVTAPTLTNGTDEVTLSDCSYVLAGAPFSIGGNVYGLSQDDGDSAALGSGEEYVAVLSADSTGTVNTTKGAKDTAGDALTPAFPEGEKPVAVVRVPYGGVIATSTLVAVSGRCLVSDAGGLVVTVHPGRAVMPGYYLTPQQVQSLTLPDDATSLVYLDATGTPSTTGGVLLWEVTTSSGDITGMSDRRTLLYQGQQAEMFNDVNAYGFTLFNLPQPDNGTAAGNAATVGFVRSGSAKPSARVVATTNQTLTSNLPTIDGVTLIEDEVALLTGQTDDEDNGLWIVHESAAWERHPWALDAATLNAGAMVFVREGTAKAKSLWIQTLAIADTATDSQEWLEVWQAP